jgi:hypothetical protein
MSRKIINDFWIPPFPPLRNLLLKLRLIPKFCTIFTRLNVAKKGTPPPPLEPYLTAINLRELLRNAISQKKVYSTQDSVTHNPPT